MIRKILFIFFLICNSYCLFAQSQLFSINDEQYIYERPNTFDFILNVPNSFVSFGSNMFNDEYTIPTVIIGASTVLFIAVDQPVYDQTSEWGRKWGIGNGDNTESYIKIGGYPLFRGPSDWGSAMYFIGDGWTHLGLSLSFLTAGLINDDNRALQTASQIAEGMIAVGITTQVLKHITGRETPSRATQEGGIWRFFPNQTKYHNNVPNYDAYPSGHVATAMMTLTVIGNNYEEYTWIRPVGYGLITLLSFQMINNGVHWLSDYPLALGIGYLLGKIVVENGRTKISESRESKSNLDLSFHPRIGFNGSIGLSINLKF